MVVRTARAFEGNYQTSSYYVLAYIGKYDPTKPLKEDPYAILQGDTWNEVVQFALLYVKNTPGGWARATTIGPILPGKGTFETAVTDVWTDENESLKRFEKTISADQLTRLSQQAGGIAQETEDDYRKKLRGIIDTMNKAGSNQNLADVLAAQYTRERNALAKERQEHLKKYGDYTKGQANLFGHVRISPFEIEDWIMEHVPGDGAMVLESDLRRQVKEAFPNMEYDYFDVAVNTLVGQRHIGRYGMHLTKIGPGRQSDLTAYETDSSGFDKALKDSRGYFTFRSWVFRNKKAEAGSMELDGLVTEARRAGADLKASEAIAKVERYAEHSPEDNTSDMPWSGIAAAIDFSSIAEREGLTEQARERLKEIGAEIKQFRDSNLIDSAELKSLTNMHDVVERLPNKQKETFLRRIEELESQLAQKEAATPPPPTPQSGGPLPKRHMDGVGPIPEPQVELLYNTFCATIARRTKRDCLPTEVTKFEDLIETIQKVRPPLKFSQAENQVKNLAAQLSTTAMVGRLVIHRGKARLNYLLDKQLTGNLSTGELDELNRIQEGGPIGPVEVIEYAPPRIEIVATKVPPKYPRKDVPFVIQRIWERSAAEREKERLEGMGFEVKIQQEGETV